ncbi:MAG: hypothetical protein ABIF71_05905 [Planctomycetota bacterium]
MSSERPPVSPRFGELACTAGYIGRSVCDAVLVEQERLNGLDVRKRIGDLLVERKLLTAGQVRAVLATQRLLREVPRFSDHTPRRCLWQGPAGGVFLAADGTVLSVADSRHPSRPAVREWLASELKRLAAISDHRLAAPGAGVGTAGPHAWSAETYTPPTLRNLADRLGERPLPAVDACYVLHQVLDVVELFGRQKLAYGQLVPEFIFLNERCNVTMLRPLITRIGGDFQQQAEHHTLPVYTAPEIFLGDRSDYAADLYAAGMIFFAMLTGRAPFEGRTVAEIVRQKELPAGAAGFREALRACSDEIVEIIHCLTLPDPGQRIARLAHVREYLRGVLDGHAPYQVAQGADEPGDAAAPPAPPAIKKRRRSFVLPLAVINVIMLILIAVKLASLVKQRFAKPAVVIPAVVEPAVKDAPAAVTPPSRPRPRLRPPGDPAAVRMPAAPKASQVAAGPMAVLPRGVAPAAGAGAGHARRMLRPAAKNGPAAGGASPAAFEIDRPKRRSGTAGPWPPRSPTPPCVKRSWPGSRRRKTLTLPDPTAARRKIGANGSRPALRPGITPNPSSLKCGWPWAPCLRPLHPHPRRSDRPPLPPPSTGPSASSTRTSRRPWPWSMIRVCISNTASWPVSRSRSRPPGTCPRSIARPPLVPVNE